MVGYRMDSKTPVVSSIVPGLPFQFNLSLEMAWPVATDSGTWVVQTHYLDEFEDSKKVTASCMIHVMTKCTYSERTSTRDTNGYDTVHTRNNWICYLSKHQQVRSSFYWTRCYLRRGLRISGLAQSHLGAQWPWRPVLRSVRQIHSPLWG